MSQHDRLDKVRVLELLRARLEQDLAVVTDAQQRTQSGATHEESRPENDKDTRALEASYLARGQAQRVAELRNAIALVARMELRDFPPGSGAAVSALIEIEDDERTLCYFLAPAGGGIELALDGGDGVQHRARVRVVTPQSPLGRALLGRGPGDVIDVKTPDGLREYSVSALW